MKAVDMNSDTDTDTAEALPFELVDPILILAARLIRPTTPHTRRLPALDAAAASAAELALTNVLLVIHPSPDLCSTLLPRLSWFTPNRTLKSSDLRFVDTWARSKSVVPFVFDIPLALATLCFARAAPARVLDWLASVLWIGQIVSNESITALFDTAASEELALTALKWWANRVPIHKDPHAVRVKQVVKEAARLAYTNVLDWLIERVPIVRFRAVLDGAIAGTGNDPRRVVEWWAAQRHVMANKTATVIGSMGEWMGHGQSVVREWGTSTFIDAISAHGCILVLDCWREALALSSPASLCRSLVSNDYTHRAIDSASEAGKLDVLKWWQSAAAESAGGLEVKHSELAMDKAHSPAILDWWLHESNLPLKYTSFAIRHAARPHTWPILDWWLQHKVQLDVQFSAFALFDAMQLVIKESRGRPMLGCAGWADMQWYAKHWQETEQCISQGFLILASLDAERVWFLKWWTEQRLPVECVVPKAIEYAQGNRWSAVVDWWQEQAQRTGEKEVVVPFKHAMVARHERECLEMLRNKLKDLNSVPVALAQ